MAAEKQGGKILVVDDLADWRNMVHGLLAEAGYEVQTAANAAEAMHLLRQQPYHVAVMDLRLNEASDDNREGLTLAEQMKSYLPELAIIMLSAYADLPSVKQALQPGAEGHSIAFDFIEKDEFPRLLDRIEFALAHAARVNPNLEIELDPALNWAKLQQDVECLQLLSPEEVRIEVTDLLQRAFYQAKRIEVKAMSGGLSSAAVVLVTPMLDDIAQSEVVVKFNNRPKAERESRNYAGYVGSFIGGARRTQHLGFRATANLGGITYSFVGARTKEFQQLNHLYVTQETDRIKTIVDNLFKETCYTWYANTLRSEGLRSLSADYRSWLHLDAAELTKALTNIVERTPIVGLSFSKSRRPDQSDIFFEERDANLTNPLAVSRFAFAYNGPYCFTHGDLHGGNILVDSYDQTWLIDFYRTGPGHPARDFAMLESSIKFLLQQSTCSPLSLYEWERSLIQAETLTKLPPADPPLQLDPELAKATKIIGHIRALSSQILPDMTTRDYQISLYFHALKAMTLNREFDERRRLHTLFSAALLAEILKAESE